MRDRVSIDKSAAGFRYADTLGATPREFVQKRYKPCRLDEMDEDKKALMGTHFRINLPTLRGQMHLVQKELGLHQTWLMQLLWDEDEAAGQASGL